MGWFYLLLAGFMEVGWPIGLKLSWHEDRFRWVPGTVAVVCMGASGLFLYLALRDKIPMGTAYAVWTGIGSIGAVVVGILCFREPVTTARLLCITLILAGVVGLKLFEGERGA